MDFSVVDTAKSKVSVENFALGHFVKTFIKKYKTHWDKTWLALELQLVFIEKLLHTSRAVTIAHSEGIRIIKVEFAVVNTKESAKTSGNRCIVAWHVDEQRVYVLLVYGKTDLPGTNETAAWKKLVKENYPQYRGML